MLEVPEEPIGLSDWILVGSLIVALLTSPFGGILYRIAVLGALAVLSFRMYILWGEQYG